MGIAHKSTKTKTKTKRRTRDLDQILADLQSPRHLAQYKQTMALEDLPGLGQHYCIPCATWFDSGLSLTTHQKAKTHKRRIKALAAKPYTQKEAEAAIGLHADNGVSQAALKNARAIEIEMKQLDVAK